jgi:CspA family cold shock protein
MSKTQNDANATPVSGSSRQLGIVKWFNNKAGFGFVTTLGDESKDVFVHHSGVSVNREQYKYLVQGEYVQFIVSTSDNNEHEWQAIDVTGIRNGPLMCETRFLNKQERTDRAPRQNDRVRYDDGRGDRRVRQRGSGPRDNKRNKSQWVLDEKNNKNEISEE